MLGKNTSGARKTRFRGRQNPSDATDAKNASDTREACLRCKKCTLQMKGKDALVLGKYASKTR